MPAPYAGDGPGMAGGMVQVTDKAGVDPPASHRSGVMEMKALSVRQPFASQIVIGEKTIEWRSKPFNWRGPLVICASKKRDHRTGQRETPARRCGPRHCGCGGMPPHDAEDLVAACCEDYEDEMYGFAWELVSPREVVPVPVKGIVAPRPFGEARN